jgi:hypothetical protein
LALRGTKLAKRREKYYLAWQTATVMLDKLKKSVQDAGEALKEQAHALGDSVKEKGYKLIEEWISVLVKLESYGFEVTSFSLSVAISPALEVEMMGRHADFGPERLHQILADHPRNPGLLSVINTIKTTYNFHKKLCSQLRDPLIVKIKIRISPEISVFIGQPLIA